MKQTGSIPSELERQVALDFAETQRQLAREHQAEPRKPRPVGACDTCGAWRTDGLPPTTHFTGCWHGEYPYLRLRSSAPHGARGGRR